MYTTTRGAATGIFEQAEGLNQQTQPREGQERTATQSSGTRYQHGHIGVPQHRFSLLYKYRIHIYGYIYIYIYKYIYEIYLIFICMCTGSDIYMFVCMCMFIFTNTEYSGLQ
jgi:hypothetical protein